MAKNRAQDPIINAVLIHVDFSRRSLLMDKQTHFPRRDTGNKQVLLEWDAASVKLTILEANGSISTKTKFYIQVDVQNIGSRFFINLN